MSNPDDDFEPGPEAFADAEPAPTARQAAPLIQSPDGLPIQR